MKDYIATFYTHFGAVSFHRKMKNGAAGVRMMPVPRALSSSCGTCVRFSLSSEQGQRLSSGLPDSDLPVKDSPDLEAVYEVREGGYAPVFQAEEPL